MADKGRDLKVSVLSDAADFDLGKPADELDQVASASSDAQRALDDLASSGAQLDHLGQSARVAGQDVDDLARSGRGLDDLGRDADQAGRKLDGLGKDSKAAGDDVDKLGKDVKATAGKVDNAFGQIAKASKAASRDVDKEMDKAGQGVDDFKDEANSSAKEAAASFTGSFDDVASTVQEIAANAFAGFGPLGAAAGLAAAAGIGVLVSSITAAKERVKELSAGLLDLRLSDEFSDKGARIRQVLDQLKDDGDLVRFKDAARDAGISWTDYVTALAEGGPVADKVNAQLQPLIDSWGGANVMFTKAGGGANDLMNRLRDQRDATEDATIASEAYQGALENLAPEEASVAVQGLGDALEGFTDSATVYADTLAAKEEAERKTAQATADATKDQKDSWEDYAKQVDVSVDDYLAALEKQVVAQEQWAGNLTKLAKRGVSEGVLAELEKMGPEGAPLVAKLTTASDAELAKLVSLYSRKGKDATDEMKDALASGKPGIAGEVQDVRDDMKRRLSGRIDVPVGVSGPSSGDLAAMRRQIFNSLSGITVTVDAIAQSALGRNVP
jgi:hypothetical protein